MGLSYLNMEQTLAFAVGFFCFFVVFFVGAAEQDKDFVVWRVCMGFSHTQCDTLSFSGPKDIISGLFVSC